MQRSKWLAAAIAPIAVITVGGVVVALAALAGAGPFSGGDDADRAAIEATRSAPVPSEGPDETENQDVIESASPNGNAPIERIIVEGAEIDNASVITLGLQDDNRTFEVPTNATQVAWYDFSGLPSQQGTAPILAAHVDYGGQKGVFWSLTEADPGSFVYLVMADGRAFKYEIVWNRDIAKSTLTWEDVGCDLEQCFVTDAITVITCGGNFNPRTRSYNDNVVVRAELVGEVAEAELPVA